jgi:hypothetical protein
MRWLLLVLTACTAAAPTEPTGPTLDFVYEGPTAMRTDLTALDCVNTVIRTHAHPSWKGFGRFLMTADGAEKWTLRFTGMPAGKHVLRIDDVNLCGLSVGGTVTAPKVLANGVRLTRQLNTPDEGGGERPGFSFEFLADGAVLP